MYCVNEGRNLRNSSSSACWRNVCLCNGTEARSSSYFGNVSLFKKHHSEKTRATKQSCSFLFKSSTECAGTIVQCPQRLLSVFDRFPTTAKPGTYICLKHFLYKTILYKNVYALHKEDNVHKCMKQVLHHC